MFYVEFLLAELRRRRGRTALTALGLAVGVGLVVVVGALSKGLDDAQAEVLEPLTGVGTDLSVSRPLAVPDDQPSAAGPAGPFGQLSRREQRRLERENDQGLSFDLPDLGKPGEPFAVDRFLATEHAAEFGRPSLRVRHMHGRSGIRHRVIGRRALSAPGGAPKHASGRSTAVGRPEPPSAARWKEIQWLIRSQ